jgi:molecular chaperone GrpE
MTKKSQTTDKQEEIMNEEVAQESNELLEESEENSAEEHEEAIEEKTKEQELEEKMAELQDRYLRLSAEYDNYRKRTLREKVDLLDGAKTDVFIHLIPVIDDLERAMEAVKSAKDIEAVKEGMNLIHVKFTNFLRQQGVTEIESLNKELNTDLHEAVTKIPVDSKKKKGKVVDVIEKGYMLRDKVIRFAKVIIGE